MNDELTVKEARFLDFVVKYIKQEISAIKSYFDSDLEKQGVDVNVMHAIMNRIESLENQGIRNLKVAIDEGSLKLNSDEQQIVHGDVMFDDNVRFDGDKLTIKSEEIELGDELNVSENLLYIDPKKRRIGINTTNPTADFQVDGTIAATTKSFIIDHPTKKGKKLRHGSLEGPENGVYVRGRTTSHTIILPEYWKGLIDEKTISLTLQPIGKSKLPAIDRIYDNKIFLKKSIIDDTLYVDCFYFIYAERKDVPKFEVEF